MIALDTSTTDELQSEFSRLAEVVVATESERGLIWQEITRRKKVAAAQVLAATLSPEERATLKGIL